MKSTRKSPAQSRRQRARLFEQRERLKARLSEIEETLGILTERAPARFDPWSSGPPWQKGGERHRVWSYIKEHGPCRLKQIAEHFGSKATDDARYRNVAQIMQRLEEFNLVKRVEWATWITDGRWLDPEDNPAIFPLAMSI